MLVILLFIMEVKRMKFNREILFEYLEGFKAYVEVNSKINTFDLLDKNDFFYKQEGYKHEIYTKVRAKLGFEEWMEDDACFSDIAQKVKQAVCDAHNLVHYIAKMHFMDKVDENPTEAGKIFYEIYCTDNDKKSFDDAIKFFGGKYNLIAYLFFIKDKSKYLPISPSNFDRRFQMLDIELRTSKKCTHKNYHQFLDCIDVLRQEMCNFYKMDISLLDAHSIIWSLEYSKPYVEEAVERRADDLLVREISRAPRIRIPYTKYTNEPKPRKKPIYHNGHEIYPRDRNVALNALSYAGNCCEINPEHQSFIRRGTSEKYMEPHHLIPMSKSKEFENSLDSEQNIICLCSNCHNEKHYGEKNEKIIERLYNNRKDKLKKIGIEISFERLKKMYNL